MRQRYPQFIKVSLAAIAIAVMLMPNAQAQINPVRTAMARMEDGKWESARLLLKKSLRKDSLNVESKYILSKWFFETTNPGFQIDSAYYYAMGSLRSYASLEAKTKDRLKRFPVDSAILITLRAEIDSAAFERAKRSNTEQSYVSFLADFSFSRYRSEAAELRDEVSYLDALKSNTYQSFKDYLERYPESHRKKEAEERYERLLFEDRTRDKKMSSYKNFIKEFPESPLRTIAERQAFSIGTASGETDDFLNFMREFPSSSYTNLSRNILFHRFKELDQPFPITLLTDSLKQVRELDAKLWLPIYKNGKYGFMDVDGNERLAPQFTHIHEDYFCGSITDEILFADDGLFARSGKRVADSVRSSIDLGFGFIQIESNRCKKLIHKSGVLVVKECADEFKVLAGRFIKARVNSTWTLYTLSGRLLTKGWADILEKENVILFQSNGKYQLASIPEVAALADGNALTPNLVFDQVTAIDQHQLLVRNGAMEGVLDQKLNFVIPLERQNLLTTAVGIIRKQNDFYRLNAIDPELGKLEVRQIEFSNNWMVLHENNNSLLYDLKSKRIVVKEADSIWFDRRMGIARQGDSISVNFRTGQSLKFKRDAKLNFITSRDTIRFFYTEAKGKKTVFHIHTGAKLFTTDFDAIESISTELFQITRKNKKFLMTRDGKLVSPLDFDQIVKTGPFQVALLRQKKFGLYDFKTKKFFKPEFERNVEALGNDQFAVFRDGHLGIINSEMKPLSEFEFEEIRPWTDSIVWVKKNLYWMLYEIATRQVILDKVRSFRLLRDTEVEKIAIIQKDLHYGVISSTKGIVIPPTFSDIINLGTDEEPFYFTEKKVEEAAIYVVIYYDRNGRLVRKQAFEEEDYEMIYCAGE